MHCKKSLPFLWKYYHDQVLYLHQPILLFSIFFQKLGRLSAVLIVIGHVDLLEKHYRFQGSAWFDKEFV